MFYLMTTPSFVEVVFDILTDVVEGVAALFVSMFTAIIAVFWDADGNTFTIPGILILTVFGIAVVRWGFGYIRNLMRLRG